MSGYIGTQPVPQATQTRDSFTATSGQTSFATGGYTPNFLDVYLNGVKLAAADYTATNGSDVVLASGAATGDILEVVAFTTFNSASSSIDDNGNAVALTIDSNENVLVGQTTNALADTGHILDSSGTAYHIRDGASPLILNRKSSDGSIAEFYKDGTTVGSIQARSSFTTLQIGSTGTGITGTSSHKILPSVNNARSDNTNDLGDSSYRWKDAYLSGGVYLGGTGSANKLDDYETGNFTPTFGGSGGNPTVSYALQSGTYVKIGNLVYVNVSVIASGTPSGGGGDLIIAGLPFTSKSGVQQAGSIAFANNMSFGSSGTQGYCNIEGGVSYLNINSQEFVGTSSMSRVPTSGIHNSSPRIVCSICYETS